MCTQWRRQENEIGRVRKVRVENLWKIAEILVARTLGLPALPLPTPLTHACK